MKKILIIIFVILIILALGIGGYFWFVGKKVEPTIPTTTSGTFPSSNDVTLTDNANGNTNSTNNPATGGQDTNTSTETATQDGSVSDTPAIVLYKKISSGPIADHPRLFGTSRNRNLLARFVEKESGRVFEYRPSESAPARITVTTVPRVAESYFSNTGTAVLLRYTDEANNIKNFLGTLPPIASTSPQEKQLLGSVITKNIQRIAPTSSVGDGFIYAENLISGGIKIMSGMFSEKGDRTLLSLPTSEWLISSPLSSTLYLQSAPTSGLFGNLYSQNTGSAGSINSIKKVVGKVVGMTSIVSPNGRYVVYSSGKKDSLSTTLLDTKTGDTRSFPVTTLPEKCVWDTVKSTRLYCAAPESMPSGKYPDDYYKGAMSFSDLLWEIDVETDSSGIVFVPRKDAGAAIDITNLSISPDGNYLIFVNKKDGALWGYDLEAYHKL